MSIRSLCLWQEGTLAKNRAEAIEALDVIRMGHEALAVGFVIGAFLQQAAARVKDDKKED